MRPVDRVFAFFAPLFACAFLGVSPVQSAQQPKRILLVYGDPPDAPAIALYESLGTRETVYHFDIAVPKSHTG